MTNILKIEKLTAYVENKKILNNFDLTIKKNEIHFIMGPNGSGKSTLAKILAGYPIYNITKGTILFQEKDIVNVSPEIRSQMGLYLAFQYPLEISGIKNFEFLKLAYNEKQKFFKKKELTPFSFLKKLKQFLKQLNLNEEFLYRDLNVGFSGGEKKINEILQILVLNPKFVILDEIDSGLDIDAIKRIFLILSKLQQLGTSFLIITHNPKIIDYIKPTKVHIMVNGKIQKSGDLDLISTIEKEGYKRLKKLN